MPKALPKKDPNASGETTQTPDQAAIVESGASNLTKNVPTNEVISQTEKTGSSYLPEGANRFHSRREEGTLGYYQVIDSVCVTPEMSKAFVDRTRQDALALYVACGPEDAAESILVRHVVALSNAGMDGYRRAALTSSLQARDVELRHAMKAGAAVIELFRFLDARRGRSPSSVNVSQVNVASGGQAIVGNVEAPQRRDRATLPPSPKVITLKDEDEKE